MIHCVNALDFRVCLDLRELIVLLCFNYFVSVFISGALSGLQEGGLGWQEEGVRIESGKSLPKAIPIGKL